MKKYGFKGSFRRKILGVKCFFWRGRSFIKPFNPFAPEPPVTARADPGPFYPL